MKLKFGYGFIMFVEEKDVLWKKNGIFVKKGYGKKVLGLRKGLNLCLVSSNGDFLFLV